MTSFATLFTSIFINIKSFFNLNVNIYLYTGVSGATNSAMAFRAVLLLSRLPQTVPFTVRVTIYEQLLMNDRQAGTCFQKNALQNASSNQSIYIS